MVGPRRKPSVFGVDVPGEACRLFRPASGILGIVGVADLVPVKWHLRSGASPSSWGCVPKMKGAGKSEELKRNVGNAGSPVQLEQRKEGGLPSRVGGVEEAGCSRA